MCALCMRVCGCLCARLGSTDVYDKKVDKPGDGGLQPRGAGSSQSPPILHGKNK